MFQHSRYQWRRRHALCALLSLPALLGAKISTAAEFPTRPIKIIVGFGPGGLSDLMARELAKGMQAKLGQSVIIENKPSAGQIVSMQAVASAPADGYTLLLGSITGLSLTPHLFKNLPVDPSKFVPIAPLTVTPNVLVALPDFGANSLTDLASHAKTKGHSVTYGSLGIGTSAHIAMAVYAKRTGVDAKHIPYRGDPTALMALKSREVDLAVITMFAALPRIKSGEIKALGIFQASPSRSLPSIQNVAQAGVLDAGLPSWSGLFAPPNTPAEVVRKLETATRSVTASSGFQDFLISRGSDPIDMDNKRFADLISRTSSQAGGAIRSLNLQPSD
ncbi:tripartite tricarboxylate transporter substrate binding protein [Cupriavidus necator]|uniref:Tripartite tricarboxylate transporter substrate binding protein n=1 Tax=Cupriavidus necator TaxID=106590 RepID=A0A367PI99_CUPNE|nr:tripartite tricarboxylate transporter substrate binding protein [Cupriavidus necator]QQX86630.1 tripartite tricarboxylate transporter substrate binding protein [Cupriavidus necator]RCJ06825.1 tripartite tricarboxylate transporter substrate binding protein [Cupriavidus necator]